MVQAGEMVPDSQVSEKGKAGVGTGAAEMANRLLSPVAAGLAEVARSRVRPEESGAESETGPDQTPLIRAAGSERRGSGWSVMKRMIGT